MSTPLTLFFDVGGVLLTNGWDSEARRRAAEAFGIDVAELETRHQMLRVAFGIGRLGLEAYLDRAVFHRPRAFTAAEFTRFLFAQSQLLGDTLEFVRALAATGKYRLYTLNNEARELHEHRVRAFELDTIFQGFLTSCYLGLFKPDEEIYRNALGIVSCSPESAVFIDDLAVNVESARVVGLDGHHFQGLDGLRAFLADRGVRA
jgi:putative hydrolase of the HAD superfamily